MSIFKNLYFDKKNQRFAILFDELMNLTFVYWHLLKKHGIRTLDDNTFLNGIVQNNSTSKHGRVTQFSSIITIDKPSCELDAYHIIQDKELDETVLFELDKAKPTVFIQCRLSEVEIENTKFYNHMVFIICTFKDNFRLINCKFSGDLWLPNIAISSLIVILIFSAVIMISDSKIVFLKAVSLSTQSFISSFFGKWDDYPPEGMLSGIVTLESIGGVIFITVFVGAYFRKRLR